MNEVLSKDHVESDEKVKMLEKRLKEVELKRSRFEELYEQEKIKVKEAAVVEGRFRAELLNIKSEKKTLGSELKSLQVKHYSIEDEVKCIKLKNKELATELKTKSQGLDSFKSKVGHLTKEKESSEIMIENLVSKVKDLKDQINLGDPCQIWN